MCLTHIQKYCKINNNINCRPNTLQYIVKVISIVVLLQLGLIKIVFRKSCICTYRHSEPDEIIVSCVRDKHVVVFSLSCSGAALLVFRAVCCVTSEQFQKLVHNLQLPEQHSKKQCTQRNCTSGTPQIFPTAKVACCKLGNTSCIVCLYQIVSLYCTTRRSGTNALRHFVVHLDECIR